MDVESESISANSPNSSSMNHMNDDPINHSIAPPICSLCQMTPSTDSFSYVTGNTVGICGHCKFLLLEDLNTPNNLHRRRGRRSTVGSSESIEDFFSQEFSQMMNLARHNQLLISDHFDPQRTSFHGTPDSSRRWRRTSDTESEGFDNIDSFYGESESNSSFGARNLVYGEDSDGVEFESDSDIDPMHTGLVTWDSDGSEEPPNRFLGLEQIIHLRFGESDFNPFYNFSRRGAPPTSESFVNNLPRVVIKKPHEQICAVCKDPILIGNEAIQLPCLHLYHPCCILPWLARRNTCPLCRHQLPTDERDYDSRNANPSSQQNESSSDDDVDVYEPMETEMVEIQQEVNNGGRGRWCFLVATPVVSILGIVLVMWLGKPQKIQRISAENNQRQSRRWWHLF